MEKVEYRQVSPTLIFTIGARPLALAVAISKKAYSIYSFHFPVSSGLWGEMCSTGSVYTWTVAAGG